MVEKRGGRPASQGGFAFAGMTKMAFGTRLEKGNILGKLLASLISSAGKGFLLLVEIGKAVPCTYRIYIKYFVLRLIATCSRARPSPITDFTLDRKSVV